MWHTPGMKLRLRLGNNQYRRQPPNTPQLAMALPQLEATANQALPPAALAMWQLAHN